MIRYALHTKLLAAVFICCATGLYAQRRVSINNVPLNEKITVELLGADKEALHCYHLYGFTYISDAGPEQGEFIVLKEADTFADKRTVEVKLCRVKEFSILSGNKCRGMAVEQGIQLRYPDKKEEVFLNFDPDGPDPVFIPCK